MCSLFSLQVNGISTVRAFGTERFFVDKAYRRLDRVQAAGYYCTKFPLIYNAQQKRQLRISFKDWMGNRFLLYRLDSMGAFVVLFASVVCFAIVNDPPPSTFCLIPRCRSPLQLEYRLVLPALSFHPAQG